ncbi:Hypothetical protein A7982_11157 [Minicystis rosea]|nr:Hypothetical protein A7982_11157 [Minicystis rosea]
MSASPRIRELVVKHRDLLVVTLAALVVRLVWNLVIHRPLDYAFSDMGGYLERAQTSIDHAGERFGYFTLFPWGTHVLLMLVKRVFGATNAAAVGVTYATLGAGAVAYAFLLARKLTRSIGLARIVGAVLVVYYPWISLGGYTLSEPPFTFFLCATTYYGLCLADRGRARDAWCFGVTLAIAAVFRPQILVALPLYGAHALFRRRAWRRLAPQFLVAVAVPLAIVFAASAWRMEHHLHRFGLISNNGPLNYAFGRCHATMITSAAPDRKGAYSPPSLGALGAYEKDHPGALFKLRPVMGPKIHFEGHMWDAEPLYRVASQCVQKSGVARQIQHGITHVVLLWAYNVMWPDSGQKAFQRAMETSLVGHAIVVLPAALVAMALAFRPRRARAMLLALHIFALMAVAAVYFGDTRLRAPYDGILVILAALTYASAYRWARRRRGAAARGEIVGNA